jgi:hypothetical protein
MEFYGLLHWEEFHVPASQRNFGIFNHNMMQKPRTPSPTHFVHFSYWIQISHPV